MSDPDDKWRQMAIDVTQPEEPGERAAPAPQVIGRFVVERQLGAGGFGIVLLAYDPTLDRHVALKLLWRGGTAGSEGRTRLVREAQAMAKLRHPNVVTVYEAGIHDAQVFLAMEYVAGGTLRAKLSATELDVWGKLALFVAAGRGLAAAHDAGLVHRDFKPDNVLIDETGVPKVTDFGLAARSDATAAGPRRPGSDLDALATPLTQTGDVMGTPRFMAPEQHEAKPTDARTDQFSFCVALYDALFGVAPFRGETVGALRHSVLNDTPVPPSDRRDVPPRVASAILRGLSRDPDARFPSMAALIAELAPPSPRRQRGALVAVAIGIPALATAGLFVLTRTAPNETEIAARAARACGCELLTLQLPAGAEVIRVRQVAGPLLLPAFAAPAWQPTHQLAVPAGPHVIEYRLGSQVLTFAVVSRGPSSTRTLVLPAHEQRAGFLFIPGGEIEIGTPPTTRELAPYLIGRSEHREDVTFETARNAASDAHARLPTAAEWEWAARLDAIESARERGWEWTATAYGLHPYLDDGRDDALAVRTASEVRGGSTWLTDRREGAHRGRGDLRLARTATIVPPLTSVDVSVVTEPAGLDDKSLRTLVAARDRSRLDRLLTDWTQLEERPPLQVIGGGCPVSQVLAEAGVPRGMIDIDETATSHATVRWHPDRTFTDPKYAGDKRRVYCDVSTEILDVICFEGERIHPAALPILDAISSTLKGNPSIELIEIQAYAPGDDALAVSQRRAERVRAAMIARGVAPARLTARGYGRFAEIKDPDGGLFSESNERPPAAEGGCPAPVDGERISYLVLKRR